MRRTKGSKLKDDDDLGAPLLSRRDSDGDGNDNESIELQQLNTRRRRNDPNDSSPTVANAPTEEDFVWHVLESHHTIAGIALQYRVTVEAVMRLNQLGTQQEMVIHDRLKIPAKAHGALLHNPEELRSADAGDNKLFTTAMPIARTEEEKKNMILQSDGTVNVTETEEAAENVSRPSPSAFLNSFDNQMQTAIQAMDETLKKQATDDDDSLAYIRTKRTPSAWELNFQDWRVAALALAVVLLISFSTVYLFEFVNAPPPH